MADEAFYGAFIDGGARQRVLGTRLRPFCPWHLLLLQALDSPFLRQGLVTRADLRTAIGVCRLRFGDSHIRRRPFLPWLTRRELARGTAEWLRYAGNFLQEPEISIETPPAQQASNTPARSAPPEALRLACDVMAILRCTEWEAWETPLGCARWYSVMSMVARGAPIDFTGAAALTPAERAYQEEMKASGFQSWQPSQGRNPFAFDDPRAAAPPIAPEPVAPNAPE